MKQTLMNNLSIYSAVGAGDTFIAGALYVLLCFADTDWSLKDKISFATELATLKVQREGFAGLGQDMFKMGRKRYAGLKAGTEPDWT